MSKINETLNLIKSGARSNKYRVLYPVFGNEIDILCNSTTMPGREIGTVEVFIKGRKFQLAGEIQDDGSWEMVFYNTPDMMHRLFFLKMLDGIHSFDTPSYLETVETLQQSDLNGGNGLSTTSSSTGFGGFLSSLNQTVNQINRAYNTVKYAVANVKQLGNTLQNAINGDLTALQSIFSSNGYSRPWYMQEIIIQQLNAQDQPIVTATLHNAFITTVSAVDYSDETQDISTTTVTFAYSGITYDGVNVPDTGDVFDSL